MQPLMSRIEATDRVIDQIVYRLYGLTEEEIEIVEKSHDPGFRYRSNPRHLEDARSCMG